MRSDYFLAARTVVNDVDPLGLIAAGAPDDEYDPEVQDLIASRAPVTAERVGEVFLRWFGAGTGDLSDDVASRIAAGIDAARLLHQHG